MSIIFASHEALDAARTRGDGLADAVIAGLGHARWSVNAQLRHVHRNDQPLPGGLPAVVTDFFARTSTLPPWADLARIERAQQWASANVLPLTVSLFCASLPHAYAGAKGARVLIATGRMQGDALERRVHETAQFLFDVIAPGSLSSKGSGLRSIQKVRLVHGAVRAQLRDGADEMPINQEDLLGTLDTFSGVVIRACRMMGLTVSSSLEDDVLHLWRVVGALLGIEEALLPEGREAARALGDRIVHRHHRASDAGRSLMQALLGGMQAYVPAMPSLPAVLVRWLSGDRLADLLDVPHSAALQTSTTIARWFPVSARNTVSSTLSRLVPLLGKPLFEAVLVSRLRGDPAEFAMPGHPKRERSAP